MIAPLNFALAYRCLGGGLAQW